jgi:2-phospho-L-lactate/phosphoenolpyruvate guanylyltransferase
VSEAGWTVVLPVKRLVTAKTRLRGALHGVPHDRLVLAMTLDTVEAVQACPCVEAAVVVTRDPVVGRAVAELGALAVPDKPDADLNAAVRHGATGTTTDVAALTADLPALRPAELAAALRAVPGRRAYVSDADGTGTTLLAARAGAPLDPHFGPGSARAHARSGAVPLTGRWPSLRRDVDTPDDLAAAARLGLGRHTSAVAAGYRDLMQATVASYDEESRSGTMLLDDGKQVAFGREAFDAGGLRLLRVGQRLRIEHNDYGEIVRVTLVTLP